MRWIIHSSNGSIGVTNRTKTGEDFVRIIKAGEHWGEREIAGDFETVSTLTALEDTKVLVLKRDVFNKLRESIPAMNKYFSQIDDHRNKIKIAH